LCSCSHALLVDTSEDVTTLQCQIFSLTGVDPAQQRIFSDRWKGALPDVANLSTEPYVVTEGSVLALWPAPAPVAAHSVPADMAAQLEAYIDLQSRHTVSKLAPLAAGANAAGLQQLYGRIQSGAKYDFRQPLGR